LGEGEKTSTVILAVSPEVRTDAQKMAQNIQAKSGSAPQMRLLVDPDHAVINRYGLLNEKAAEKGLPHPATYAIDRQGVVRWKSVDVNYRLRPSNDAIREALAAAP
jgi:peroxiredoxin